MWESSLLFYILDGTEIKKAASLEEYHDFMESRKNVLQQDMIGEVMVSTVFLCLDHSFRNGEEPILFETMVFGGQHDEYQKRYCTYDDAMEGHESCLKMVKSSILN